MNPRDQADHDGLTLTTPHDDEAEALVISAIMHSAQAYNDCATVINREDIYKPAHRLIWDVVAGLVATNTPPHPVLIRAEIERQGRLREVDGGT
ncbi:MAG: DnaB-like helicase N-terminal domain-containing protein, partial [Pseudonocardia sp.]